MEPLGFRLWFRNVIFNSSHVEGGVCEGCGRRVAFCGGVEVSKDHGIGTRFSRVLGNDELEPSSRGPPRGGGPWSTRFSFVCADCRVVLGGAPLRASYNQRCEVGLSPSGKMMVKCGVAISPPWNDSHGGKRLVLVEEVSWGILQGAAFIIMSATAFQWPRIGFGACRPTTRWAYAADANIVWLRTLWGKPQGFIFDTTCATAFLWPLFGLGARRPLSRWAGAADADIVWLRTLRGRPQGWVFAIGQGDTFKEILMAPEDSGCRGRSYSFACEAGYLPPGIRMAKCGVVISPPWNDFRDEIRLVFIEVASWGVPQGAAFTIKSATAFQWPRIGFGACRSTARWAYAADVNIVWFRTLGGKLQGFIIANRCATAFQWPQLGLGARRYTSRWAGAADADTVWLSTLWGRSQGPILVIGQGHIFKDTLMAPEGSGCSGRDYPFIWAARSTEEMQPGRPGKDGDAGKGYRMHKEDSEEWSRIHSVRGYAPRRSDRGESSGCGVILRGIVAEPLEGRGRAPQQGRRKGPEVYGTGPPSGEQLIGLGRGRAGTSTWNAAAATPVEILQVTQVIYKGKFIMDFLCNESVNRSSIWRGHVLPRGRIRVTHPARDRSGISERARAGYKARIFLTNCRHPGDGEFRL